MNDFKVVIRASLPRDNTVVAEDDLIDEKNFGIDAGGIKGKT